MKTLLILLASTAILIAADPVRRIGPRTRTNAVSAAPKPQSPSYGPQHNIESIPGVKIIVISTNQFSMEQLRRWLMEAARTVK